MPPNQPPRSSHKQVVSCDLWCTHWVFNGSITEDRSMSCLLTSLDPQLIALEIAEHNDSVAQLHGEIRSTCIQSQINNSANSSTRRTIPCNRACDAHVKGFENATAKSDPMWNYGIRSLQDSWSFILDVFWDSQASGFKPSGKAPFPPPC